AQVPLPRGRNRARVRRLLSAHRRVCDGISALVLPLMVHAGRRVVAPGRATQTQAEYVLPGYADACRPSFRGTGPAFRRAMAAGARRRVSSDQRGSRCLLGPAARSRGGPPPVALSITEPQTSGGAHRQGKRGIEGGSL